MVFPPLAYRMLVLILELARCEYPEPQKNVIALGNSCTYKSHIALGLAACV